MNKARLEELAAAHAVGALEGAELTELNQFLASGDPGALATSAQFSDLMTLAALARSKACEPSPGLKSRVLGAIRKTQPAEVKQAGMQFVFAQDKGAWHPLAVPGAWVKLLALDSARGFAVVLGRLDAGASYPPHRHLHSEQIYVLSGDLHIGAQRLGPGDFHQAGAGSTHGVNRSETGCTILAVISTEDLQIQMAAV